MELTSRRRRALSTLLACLLAAELVSAVAAAGLTATGREPAGLPVQAVAAELSTSTQVARAAVVAVHATGDAGATARLDGETRIPGVIDRAGSVLGQARALVVGWSAAVTGLSLASGPQPAAVADIAAAGARTHKDKTGSSKGTSATTKSKGTTTPTATVKRSGRNHVWIPSLGINRSVSWFPCDRKRPPDNFVYRWGCAGSNNIYLLGHAYSVFKPLHDAYVRGRLRVGLTAYYADAKGKVHTYKVRWWKVTAPTTAASWAWASLGRPSMTLQTCVGKNSAYRLMVRLVQVKA